MSAVEAGVDATTRTVRRDRRGSMSCERRSMVGQTQYWYIAYGLCR